MPTEFFISLLDRDHPVTAILADCSCDGLHRPLHNFLPFLADPRTTARIDFVTLDRRPVLRGSLVRLNEDVIDDTGEALALTPSAGTDNTREALPA